MGVHEVLIATSLKEMLTHSCPLVTKEMPEKAVTKREVVAIPWGQDCPHAKRNGCTARNPPEVNGSQFRSFVMTDAQIREHKKRWGAKTIKLAPDSSAKDEKEEDE